jgi:hypothetical protein
VRGLDAFVRLYKERPETRSGGDLQPGFLQGFDDLLHTVPAEERAALLQDLAAFLRAERARLVKLKTLGFTAGYEEKIRITEQLLSWVRGERG